MSNMAYLWIYMDNKQCRLWILIEQSVSCRLCMWTLYWESYELSSKLYPNFFFEISHYTGCRSDNAKRHKTCKSNYMQLRITQQSAASTSLISVLVQRLSKLGKLVLNQVEDFTLENHLDVKSDLRKGQNIECKV